MNPDSYSRVFHPSPVVHPDRSVRFAVLAPGASRVELVSGALCHELGGVRAFERTDQGMWRLTVGPLRPDLYDYGIAIDGGLRTVDTLNPHIEQLRWGSLSLVDVPDTKPSFYYEQNHPRGTVHFEHFHSTVFDAPRRCLIYTPPGYDPQADTAYPVLYLLHGSGQMENSWYETGRMHAICDNLLAQGLMQPLVVVMPYGHIHRAIQADEPARTSSEYIDEEKAFFDEIVPLAESRYRISRQPGKRAIAGLSMGSNQARVWGLDRPGHFFSVGIFSNRRDAQELCDLPRFLDPANKLQRPEHTFVAMGEGEDHLAGWQELSALLRQQGVRVTQRVYPGNHSFVCWRRCLRDYLGETFPPHRPPPPAPSSLSSPQTGEAP